MTSNPDPIAACIDARKRATYMPCLRTPSRAGRIGVLVRCGYWWTSRPALF